MRDTTIVRDPSPPHAFRGTPGRAQGGRARRHSRGAPRSAPPPRRWRRWRALPGTARATRRWRPRALRRTDRDPADTDAGARPAMGWPHVPDGITMAVSSSVHRGDPWATRDQAARAAARSPRADRSLETRRSASSVHPLTRARRPRTRPSPASAVADRPPACAASRSAGFGRRDSRSRAMPRSAGPPGAWAERRCRRRSPYSRPRSATGH